MEVKVVVRQSNPEAPAIIFAQTFAQVLQEAQPE